MKWQNVSPIMFAWKLRARATSYYDDVQPFRWSLHGGLGRGKSHMIKTIKTELFELITV